MKPRAALLVFSLLALPAAAQVTTASLLIDMTRLDRLARTPDPPYQIVQFSSYDRRSTHAEAPGWFKNSDGFGGEPIPGFERVLIEPGVDGIGTYLVAAVDGPGAIVRGWSAGMDGVLRVVLDGAEKPVFEGKAYDFLARRSVGVLKALNLETDPGDAFVQQDADYFPVPFAKSLRVTWTGRLRDLHFYHLQVRRYPSGTPVETFNREVMKADPGAVMLAVAALTGSERSQAFAGESETEERFALDDAKPWMYSPPEGPRAVVRFRLRLDAEDPAAALRRTLLRISFDGSERPQVEAPAGDFFGSGIGVNPFESLPMSVAKDGLRTCRFVMPYERSARIELRNWSGKPVNGVLTVRTAPFEFTDRTMHFRAKWRVDHDLNPAEDEGPEDLPYLMIKGEGVMVGAACMLMNPSPIPTAGGNWWGEGDEKVLVDDDLRPSIFGTGSEDFFNYSWSRPDLFAHPFCGQPLDSGPDTAGYVSNHRFFVLDAVPFTRALWFGLESWSHDRPPGLSYARIVWHYARPGAIDDHRRLTPKDLVVPPLPRWEPKAAGGASRARFLHLEDLAPEVTAGMLRVEPLNLVSRGRVLTWSATKDAQLKVRFMAAEDGEHAIALVAVHAPGSGAFRATLDGDPLPLGDKTDVATLAIDHGLRALNVRFAPRALAKGDHELALECVTSGPIAMDYLWIRPTAPPARKITGAVEGEALEIAGRSPEVEAAPQNMGPAWSAGRHLWVKATAPGQFVDLRLPVPAAGRYRVVLHLTKSWDYGLLAVRLGGTVVRENVDTWNAGGSAPMDPLDLGVQELAPDAVLRLEVTGRNEKSTAPGTYFGLDAVVLEPAK